MSSISLPRKRIWSYKAATVAAICTYAKTLFSLANVACDDDMLIEKDGGRSNEWKSGAGLDDETSSQ